MTGLNGDTWKPTLIPELIVKRKVLDQSNLLNELGSGSVVGRGVIGLTLIDEGVEGPEITLSVLALVWRTKRILERRGELPCAEASLLLTRSASPKKKESMSTFTYTLALLAS